MNTRNYFYSPKGWHLIENSLIELDGSNFVPNIKGTFSQYFWMTSRAIQSNCYIFNYCIAVELISR